VPRPRILCVVGLNPFRAQQRRPSDYLLVGVTLLVILGLVLWAFL
jgi:hypothetical protein